MTREEIEAIAERIAEKWEPVASLRSDGDEFWRLGGAAFKDGAEVVLAADAVCSLGLRLQLAAELIEILEANTADHRPVENAPSATA
jgi:hypothetical protein